MIKLPFRFYIGRKEEAKPEPRIVYIRAPEPEPTMSKYELDKLEPKSWKTGIWQQKPWKAKGISWNQWRSQQANMACDYYAQGNCSQQQCADQFGISVSAFVQAWRYFKHINEIEVVCR